MKKLCFVVLTCFALGSFSHAPAAAVETVTAQPSLHTTINEFRSLVNDNQLSTNLSSDEHVYAIFRNDEGFTILTNKHKIKVDIVAGKVGKGGQQEYHLVFHKPEVKKDRHQMKEKFKEKFKERRDKYQKTDKPTSPDAN